MMDRRKWMHALETIVVRAFVAVASRIPRRAGQRVGALLGAIAWSVLRIRRKVAMGNIQRSLGVSAAECRRIGRRSYAGFGQTAMETVRLVRTGPDALREFIDLQGGENFDAVLARGRGAIVYLGHFGNWELLGAAIPAFGYPFDAIVGQQSNRSVDAIFVSMRKKAGMGTISRDEAARGALRALAANRLVGMAGDQDARRHGVFVDFLGRPASTAKGAAVFAIRQRCPVLFVSIRREKGGRHTLVAGQPMWADPALSGEAAVVELLQRCTRCLEEAIRDRPDQYFWPHRRWKTQPLPRTTSSDPQ